MSVRAWAALVCFILCWSHVRTYPSLYVARDATECTDHPLAAFGRVHDYTAAPDKTVSFSLTSASTGKAPKRVNGVTTVCAGDSYNVLVEFGAPSQRNYLLTATDGTFSYGNNDCDAWCPNRVCSAAPAAQSKSVFSLPCDTVPGRQVQLKVTSANGRIPAAGSTLRSATLSLQVDGPCPDKCASAVRAEQSHFKKAVAGSAQAHLRTGQPAGSTGATGA